MKSVELFAGAGGLGLGIALSGFEPVAVLEWDKWACDTLRENQKRGYPLVQGWPIHEGDVRHFDWSQLNNEVDLLSGGPPCQPFSMGGKHQAFGDDRDMFPPTIEAVRRIKPKAFIIENVKGLTRASFADYLEYIQCQLSTPELIRHADETWAEHLLRLRQQNQKTAGGLTYNVTTTLVNAANYGVPQKRERVFIVGFRSDLGADWHFPKATHSLDALLYEQWVTGSYWERHGISATNRPAPPARSRKRIDHLSASLLPPEEQPWRTVRDALIDLPEPTVEPHIFYRNHKFQDGARTYKGHTGSPLDLPSKTLKAGDHGVPGGENMLVRLDDSVRYFSVRESARLQTFPDGYIFHGSWTETMRQLGNAVPVALAQLVASSVAEKLAELAIQHQISNSDIEQRIVA